MNVINACTRDCYDACSIISRVRNDSIVGIDGNKSHPITQGIICQRMRSFSKQLTSKHRLSVPLKSVGERGSGLFEKISWDMALKEIAERIKEETRKFSSLAFGLFDSGGNKGLLASHFPLRFVNANNGSVAADTLCSAAGEKALELSFGSYYGYPSERIPESRLIVLWGVNSKWTNMHGAMLVQKAKKRGATVWVIDPLRTATTELGKHLQIRPGTDAALALTMINHIIENDMHDKTFIEKHITGFKNLVEIARKYDIHRGSEITGLDEEDIARLAVDFVTLRPSVIHIGFGLQRQRNGGEMVRSISLIPAMVGQHRGFIYSNDEVDFDFEYLEGSNLRTLPENSFNPLTLPRLLAENKLRVLLIINSNPLATLPNQEAVRSALKESDAFVVTHDLFMTDTADFSDLILPATSMFEQDDIVKSYFHDYVNLNEAAIPPYGESRSNATLFRDLAKAMGLRNQELFENDESIIMNLLRSSKRLDVDMSAFRKRGFAKLSPIQLDVYQTPSGKIEIYSEKAKKEGLPPVPDHVPIKGTGSFQLITPCTIEMNHSSYHILEGQNTPKFIVNPDDASSQGIKEGNNITLKNRTGSLTLPVEISGQIPKGVIVSYAGFWPKLSGGKNINFLTTDYVQRFGGNSAYNSTFVNLVR